MLITVKAGEVIVSTDGNTSGGSSGVRGGIHGLTLANNSYDVTNGIDIFAGCARDSTNAYDLDLPAGIMKRLDTPWLAGTGKGGLDTGSKANCTSYHVHLIRKDADGSTDALFSTSPTSPVLPAGYTARRRIGAVVTNGAGAIRLFRQVAGWFHYADPPLDVSAAASDTVPILRTLSVPAGVKVQADLLLVVNGPVGSAIVRDPDLGPTLPNGSVTVYRPTNAVAVTKTLTWTSTARQVFTADSTATGEISIYVQGWLDTRDEHL